MTATSGTAGLDEDNKGGGGGLNASASSSSSSSEKRKWHGRTVKMMELLALKFSEAEGDSITYQDLAENHKRRVVAGAFFEVLQLKTWGRIDIKQAEPYGVITITKTESFDDAIPA